MKGTKRFNCRTTRGNKGTDVNIFNLDRLNMWPPLVPLFQTTLLHFWEKTSHTMAAIHESFKGCQHYEFSALKVREPLDLYRWHLNVYTAKVIHTSRESANNYNQWLGLFFQTLKGPMDKLAKKKGKKKIKAEAEDGKKAETTDDQWVISSWSFLMQVDQTRACQQWKRWMFINTKPVWTGYKQYFYTPAALCTVGVK